MTLATLARAGAVKARALALGLDAVAIGPATPPDHAAEYDRWLEAGHAGTMSYLARGRDDRVDPARLLPGARSVVAVALSYNPGEDDPPEWAGVARYARGRDYHDVMRPRLHDLATMIDTLGTAIHRSRVAVDTSAVLERDLAARAGLGWIGKNTNLMSEALGSYVFIGIVLTTADLAFDAPVADRCGTCTACLEACPTAAFAGPYVLDARRCVSYLTIEHRGAIAGALWNATGEWLFGCDVCQEVCPWNRKARPSREPSFRPAREADTAETLLGLDDSAFRQRFQHSAMKRAKLRGLRRNAALALARRSDPAAGAALERVVEDPDPVIREVARSAVARIV
jgi:epoxyqueuosine reductase